ncbi:hypothetical protein HDU96_003511 [Phlyctochytrium bullatum]|nr:hypothetical protein HDU96_003511 [Phlyctochytrium bullatum]
MSLLVRKAVTAAVLDRVAEDEWAYQRQRQKRKLLYLMMIRQRSLIHLPSRLYSDSLVDPRESSWYQLYEARDPASFMKFTSFYPEAFDELLTIFEKEYVVLSGPGKRGRPPRVADKHLVLGSLLHFYSAPVEHKTLSVLFGIPPSTLSQVLSNAEEALLRGLRGVHASRIAPPSKRTHEKWAAVVEAKEPLLKGIIGFLDGKNYCIHAPSC